MSEYRNSMMKYVKDKHGRKIGMLLAVPVSTNVTTICFGWSRCKAGDAFSRELGREQARANIGEPIPPSFEKAARAFRLQCVDHFDKVEKFQTIRVMDYPRQPKAVKPRKTVHNGGHHPDCDWVKHGAECDCKDLFQAEAHARSHSEACPATE
jgi:hypothetical protein